MGQQLKFKPKSLRILSQNYKATNDINNNLQPNQAQTG